jgi:hypothetical protein
MCQHFVMAGELQSRRLLFSAIKKRRDGLTVFGAAKHKSSTARKSNVCDENAGDAAAADNGVCEVQ